MIAAGSKSRIAWADPFRQPSLDELWAHYDQQKGNLVDLARKTLLAFDGVDEQIAWRGVSWKWALNYRSPADQEPWAYLVPAAEKLRLAMPLDVPTLQSIPLHRLKKYVRDGIRFGRQVADVVWASWEITNKTELEEVMGLVKRRHKLMTAAAN